MINHSAGEINWGIPSLDSSRMSSNIGARAPALGRSGCIPGDVSMRPRDAMSIVRALPGGAVRAVQHDRARELFALRPSRADRLSLGAVAAGLRTGYALAPAVLDTCSKRVPPSDAAAARVESLAAQRLLLRSRRRGSGALSPMSRPDRFPRVGAATACRWRCAAVRRRRSRHVAPCGGPDSI